MARTRLPRSGNSPRCLRGAPMRAAGADWEITNCGRFGCSSSHAHSSSDAAPSSPKSAIASPLLPSLLHVLHAGSRTRLDGLVVARRAARVQGVISHHGTGAGWFPPSQKKPFGQNGGKSPLVCGGRKAWPKVVSTASGSSQVRPRSAHIHRQVEEVLAEFGLAADLGTVRVTRRIRHLLALEV